MSFIKREDIERFLFNFDEILNYKNINNASTPNTNDDEEIGDTTT